MKSRELNYRFIAALPSLKQAYGEQTEWQEGDDTGSHDVYEDVLVPAILVLLKGNNFKAAKRYFDFCEDTLMLEDDYATEVIATSVLESIYFDEVEKAEVEELLGERCLAIWEGFESTG